MRLCIYCGCEKFYNGTAKPKSKASGFYGLKCWDCMLMHNNKRRSTPEMRAKLNATTCAWQKKYPEKANAFARAWRKKHPEKHLANTYEYKARKLRQLPADWDPELTNQTIAEIRALGLTVDHMVSLNEGGVHAWYNLNALPGWLNSKKNSRSIDAPCWLQMRADGEPIEAYEEYVLEQL